MFTNLAILGAPHCGILTEILVDTLRCHPKRLENTENPWDMWQAEKVWKRSGYFSHSKHSGNNRKKNTASFDSSSCDLILGRSAPDFHIFCYGSKDEANVGWCIICWTSAGFHETLLVKTSENLLYPIGINWFYPGVMRIIMAILIGSGVHVFFFWALSCAFHSAMVRIY